MNSLRWRLIWGILAGITLVLVAGGMVAYFQIRERLYAQSDRSLVQRAAALATLIKEEHGTVKIEWLEFQKEPPGHREGLDYFSVRIKKNGKVLTESPDLHGYDLPDSGGTFANPLLQPVILPGNRPGRCASIEFLARLDQEDGDDDVPGGNTTNSQRPRQPALVQLVVAKVDNVAPTVTAVRRLLIGLWAACTALAGLMVWWCVRQGLRPLDDLRAGIVTLDETTPGQRITLQRQPSELKPVTRELNHLLERIEKALIRERNLTSNVAHELRTPIAGILSTLEVALSRARPAEEYRESLEECLEIAKRMHWLANNLLSIARIEAGRVKTRSEAVPIEQSFLEWWDPFAVRAAQRRIQVVWKIAPGLELQTDHEFLHVVMSNLFDNSVSYASEGGAIHITATRDGYISVANTSVDLKPDLVQHVFDPFWRNSETRDEVGLHAGLGLSLCKKIVELFGGRISAEVRERENLFIVRLDFGPPVTHDNSPPGSQREISKRSAISAA